MTTVAVMQPTFLPWLGYFAMAHRADVFVFLDDAQFVASSWHSMNHVKTANGKTKISLPVFRPNGYTSTINECTVHPMEGDRWLKKFRKTLMQNYDLRGDVPLAYYHTGGSVGDANVNTILQMGAQLGIPHSRWVRRSEILSKKRIKAYAGFDDVLRMLRFHDATTYLAAPGTKTYMTPKKYRALEDLGIELKWHDYTPAPYKQRHGEFIPYCSALDFIYNHSPEEAATYLAGQSNVV